MEYYYYNKNNDYYPIIIMLLSTPSKFDAPYSQVISPSLASTFIVWEFELRFCSLFCDGALIFSEDFVSFVRVVLFD